MTTLSPPSAIARLRAAVRDLPPLPGLTPERYALSHSAYEQASDQRSRLQRWVVATLPPLLSAVVDRPLAVLGVGVGDGSVDAPLAAALASGQRRVDYVGVEPHAPSAAAFVHRLDDLRRPGLRVRSQAGHFGDGAGAPQDPRLDLVHFVHSLYYVPDVGAALDHALAMLRPGGVLLAFTAPREPLCVLTELLAPKEGHPQWFADTVRDALRARGLTPNESRVTGRLDLRAVYADPCGKGELVLDFLVQAGTRDLPGQVRSLLLAYLEEIEVEPGCVPHPIDALVVTAPE